MTEMSEPKSPREMAAEKFAELLRNFSMVDPKEVYLAGWDACLAHHAQEREAAESLAAAFESITKRAQLMFFITEVEHIDDFLKDARLAIKAYRKAKEQE